METRAYPIANLPFVERARIAATVRGTRGSSGSHAAASAAAAAAMMIVVDSSRWITRRRGWRPIRRRAGKRRGDETRGCQLADLHNMTASRFVSSRRFLTSTLTDHCPMWKREKIRRRRTREREWVTTMISENLAMHYRCRPAEGWKILRTRARRRKQSERIRDRRYTGRPDRARLDSTDAPHWPSASANRDSAPSAPPATVARQTIGGRLP